MKKIIFTILTILLISIVFGFKNSVSANEGKFTLVNGSISCEGVSIWTGTDYEISGKCYGLVYPYQSEIDRYVLWVQNIDGSIEEIEEVERGILEGSNEKPFNKLFLTAENESFPDTPSKNVMAVADIQSFSKSDANKPQTNITLNLSPTPTPLAIVPLTTGQRSFFTSGRIAGIVILFLIIAVIFILIRRK